MEQNIQTHKIDIRGTIALAAAIVAVAAGLVESVWGWGQLLGTWPSGHARYPATGSFYNPGPYCGFLAVCLPVALRLMLSGRWRWLEWSAAGCVLLSVGIMPVLMGRTGWIAAAVGCASVAVGCGKLRLPRGRWLAALIVLAAVAATGIILLKPQSAMGRLFLWRIEWAACCDSPLTGVGWDKVAGAIGRAQEAYFSARPQSVFAHVAGSPEYAFNEFFQIGIAFGLPCAVAFAGLLVWAAMCAWRSGSYGIAAGVIAFAIVCLASYPLQFAEFIVLAGVLVIAAIASWRGVPRSVMWTVVVAVATCSLFSSLAIIDRRERANQWSAMSYAYRFRLSPHDIRTLDSLGSRLGNNPRYLFDYGKTLRESGLYDKSTQVLTRGLDYSSDPMFLNLIGRNCESTGRYDEAVRWYLRSTRRLPQRLYPYYLLAKLYAAPASADSSRFERIYEAAIATEPKVKSPATTQMLREIRQLRDSISTR